MSRNTSGKRNHSGSRKDNYPIGEMVKVHVWGEAPWASVTEVISPMRMMAKIENHLICIDEHGLDYGDIAEFELEEDSEGYGAWVHVVAAKGQIIKFPKVDESDQGAR